MNVSTRLQAFNNSEKLILRRIHRNGNCLSIGLPKEIVSQLKVESFDYLKVFYDSKNQAVIYKKLEEDVKN